MKRITITTITVLLSAMSPALADDSYQCPPGTQKKESPADNGEREVACLKDGKAFGKVINYTADGKKRQEREYENDQPNGQTTSWWPNGKVRTSVTFDHGKKSGHQINYYENGQVSFEGDYKAGKPVGLHLEWYSNGKKQSEINYSKNEEKYWNEDGSINRSKEIQQAFGKYQCVQSSFVCPDSDNKMRWPFRVVQTIGENLYEVSPITDCRVKNRGGSFCDGANCRSTEQVDPINGNHIILSASSADFKSSLRAIEVNGVKGQYLPENLTMRIIGKKVLPNAENVMQEYPVLKVAPECDLIAQGKIEEAKKLMEPQSDGVVAKMKSWFHRSPAADSELNK